MAQTIPIGRTYTNPQGGTPQGTDIANTLAMITNLPAQPQLTQSMGQTAQELAAMQTPQARGEYITRSDLPAMQQNYEDVARQLYNYDKMALSPMYAQAPGQPSDAPAFGRVPASTLMQLTPELAAGPTTLFADNPRYAAVSQNIQQGSVLDVLDSLNQAIGREFEAKRGQYASTVKAKQSVLDTISSLLDKRITIDEAAKDRAARLAERGEGEAKLNAVADDVKAGLTLGDVMQKHALKVDPDEILRIYNTYSPYGVAKEPNEDLSRRFGVSLTKTDDKLSSTAKTTATQYLSYLQDLQSVRDSLQTEMGDSEGFISDLLAGVTGPIAQWKGAYGEGGGFRQSLSRLEANIKKGAYGSVLSKYELEQAKNWIPSTGRQETVNLKRLNDQISLKERELRNLLATFGLSEEEISSYLNQAGQGGVKERPPIESFDE